MPLSDLEKAALSHFLQSLDGTVLCRLGGSVTNGSINPSSREDAYNCIMLHTESLFQFLNLKRVNRDILLKYLHNLNEPISGNASKEEMIQRIYQKWNLPFSSKNVYNPLPLTLANMQVLPAQMPATNNSYSQSCHQFQMMIEAARLMNGGLNHDPLSQMVRSKEVLKEMNSMAFGEYIVGFADTFYELLNNSSDGPWLHSFNDSHFFSECKLKIMIKGATEDIELEGEGIHEALSVLSDLKKEHKLFFKPNLTQQGLRSKEDSHGLVSVAVCGTLHQLGGPVGVFEQCLILSADPFAKGSYKILETVLILRSSNAVSSMSELMMLTSSKRNEETLAVESRPSRVLAITDTH